MEALHPASLAAAATLFGCQCSSTAPGHCRNAMKVRDITPSAGNSKNQPTKLPAALAPEALTLGSAASPSPLRRPPSALPREARRPDCTMFMKPRAPAPAASASRLPAAAA